MEKPADDRHCEKPSGVAARGIRKMLEEVLESEGEDACREAQDLLFSREPIPDNIRVV